MAKVRWGTTAPHRVLAIASPAMRGNDVRALQKGINARDRGDARRGIGQVTVDGIYGPATEAAGERASYALGTLASTRARRGTTVGEQTYIRAPRARPASAIARANARTATAGRGGSAAVRAARSKVGTAERPAGSNRGPGFIDSIQIALMGWAGWPWCGAFAAWCVKQAGGTPHARWRYTPWIVEDAKTKRNGLAGWRERSQNAPAGSLVLFDFPGGEYVDHVGILVSIDRKAGTVRSIDGNTSGSNPADGGRVDEVVRQLSTVRGFALVDYP